MSKMILMFSHRLTEGQSGDAYSRYNIEEFLYLPEDLQKIWSLIPPDLEDISSITDKFKEWLEGVAHEDDYILVQGDFGMTYEMVRYCKEKRLKAIYSTTERRAKEIIRDDGKIEITHEFEHVRYREY